MILAPMAGITNSVFRRLIRALGGCGLVCSEMTNAASVTPKAMRQHKLLDYTAEEHPIAMQISGSDPELMAAAARSVQELGADVVDINGGCPSPTVTRGGHGAALLRDLSRFEAVLKAVRAAVTIPMTVKIRAGWDAAHLNYLETARMVEAVGADALIVHPRTREQRYGGEADWNRIAEIKRLVSIPVIGNGDVRTAHDALERLASSGVDGIMIGRGALANPWIFAQIAQLRQGAPLFIPSPQDKYHFLLRFIAMGLEELPERVVLNLLKQLISWLVIGVPGCAALRAHVHRSRDIAEARSWLEIFFASLP